MPLPYNRIAECLDEAERELLRVGREHCAFLRQPTQLSAVILLLLRSASLFRSMIELSRSEMLDAFDSVRRAFLESWSLAFQFRMEDPKGEVGRWLAQRPDSWNADIRRLDDYARGRGHHAPNLGRDYGELSELAHPTLSAAHNSAALILRRMGIPNEDERQLLDSMAKLEAGMPAMLYRILWLVLDEGAGLIPLYVNASNLPTAVQFVQEFPTIA